MKNNQLTGMLLVLLLLSTLASVGLILKYNSAFHRLQRMQPELAAAGNARGLIQAILNDTVEYSKTHPDINKVLQPYISNGKQTGTATVPARPNK